MHGIIMVEALHLAASPDTGTSVVEIIAWIGIPLFLAICGAIFGIVKLIIRFAQYMTKSETAQSEIAKTNVEIRDILTSYMAKTDTHLGVIDQDIAVLKYKTSANGARKRVSVEDDS